MRESSIIDVSRSFFFEVVKPILERNFPEETAQTTFGVFGYGSEVLWGLGQQLDPTRSPYNERRCLNAGPGELSLCVA